MKAAVIACVLILCAPLFADQPPAPPVQVSGVFPQLGMVADHSPRTEAGTGAIVPWAGRLWVVTGEVRTIKAIRDHRLTATAHFTYK